mmetsp:Transcript_18267/g.55122  ORF Transcript_18267/g.55122 Transcript_18267/m.55122 type:complete len:288 (-) Transcript_18267:323-1186(-)
MLACHGCQRRNRGTLASYFKRGHSAYPSGCRTSSLSWCCVATPPRTRTCWPRCCPTRGRPCCMGWSHPKSHSNALNAAVPDPHEDGGSASGCAKGRLAARCNVVKASPIALTAHFRVATAARCQRHLLPSITRHAEPTCIAGPPIPHHRAWNCQSAARGWARGTLLYTFTNLAIHFHFLRLYARRRHRRRSTAVGTGISGGAHLLCGGGERRLQLAPLQSHPRSGMCMGAHVLRDPVRTGYASPFAHTSPCGPRSNSSSEQIWTRQAGKPQQQCRGCCRREARLPCS